MGCRRGTADTGRTRLRAEPDPLVEMVLVLFSRRALTNGLVFLGCIMLPVFVIPFLGAAGQDAAAATASERSTTQGVILSWWPWCCW